MPEVPHFAYPFERGPDGKVKTVEQGSPEHVQAVDLAIINCPLGFRDERPDFGWPMPFGRPAPVGTGPLQHALEEFGLSARRRAEEYADEADAATRHMTVYEEV